jgi:hypothetical protein
MNDVMKDVIDPPAPARSRGAIWQIGVSVLLSVACSVPITLAIVHHSRTSWHWGTSSVPELLSQRGTFKVVAGQEGEVHFPIPYEFPPSVEISADRFCKTIVVESTTRGFRWKNSGPDDVFNNIALDWSARGVPIRQP